MKRILLFMAAAAAIAVVPFQAGAAGPPPRFELSPASLSFSASAGNFDYHSVTVTNNRGPLVIQNPASSDDGHFFDPTGRSQPDTPRSFRASKRALVSRDIPAHSGSGQPWSLNVAHEGEARSNRS